MYTHCPKCGHHPLPEDQALPSACPSCGVILAKVLPDPGGHLTVGAGGSSRRARPAARYPTPASGDTPSRLRALLFNVAALDPVVWGMRAVLWLAFAVWGGVLIAQDYRTGDMGASFIHGPLLVFHEAGHVVFRLLGDWMGVLGGTLGQLIMPGVLAGALLLKNRDPFAASIGLWFFGVSLLDIAPYVFDALQPQLMLLSGATGEEGGHDWIYLLSSMGLLAHSQVLGALVHKLGALTVLLALAWAGWILWRQRALRVDDSA